jgi:hypothetical protein
MNQRNVDALAKLFEDAEFDGVAYTEQEGGSYRAAAEFFAARGVLVPASLTDAALDAVESAVEADCEHWLNAMRRGRAPDGTMPHLAAVLERTARGEP